MWFNDDEVSYRNFLDELNNLGNVSEITVRINSCGGDVFAAYTIYSRLKDHSAKIIVKIDGICASAATLVAMAADKGELIIADGGTFMIHNLLAVIYGAYNAKQLEEMAKQLEEMKPIILSCYKGRTGKTDEEIIKLLDAETWLIGEQAVQEGFCDKTVSEQMSFDINNNGDFVLNNVVMDAKLNIPKELKDRFLNTKSGFLNTKNNDKGDKTVEIKNIEDFKKEYPEIFQETVNNAKIEGAKKEIERLKAIDDISMPGFEELVNKAKFEEPITAEELAVQMINAQKKLGIEYIENVGKDSAYGGLNNLQGGSNQGGVKDNEAIGIINKVFGKK